MSAHEQHNTRFIGIGDQKSATSWLFQCLSEHPDICTSSEKETRFFDDEFRFSKGEVFYESFFASCQNSSVQGEFSPSYIHTPHVAGRIKDMFPDAKLIVCLRNPIEKLYSEFWFNKVGGRGSMTMYQSLEEALDKAPFLISGSQHFKNLQPFIQNFDPSQIHVIIYDDINCDPKKVLHDLYEYLGVDSRFVPPSVHTPVNQTGNTRIRYPKLFSAIHTVAFALKKVPGFRFIERYASKKAIVNFLARVGVEHGAQRIERPVMKAETRAKLREFYKEDIRALSEYLQRDLSFWK